MKTLKIPEGFNAIFKYGPYKLIVAERILCNTPVVILDNNYLSFAYRRKMGILPTVQNNNVFTTEVVFEKRRNTITISEVCINTSDRLNEQKSNIRLLGKGLFNDIFTEEEILKNCLFVLSEKEGNSLIISKYELDVDEAEIRVNPIDKFSVFFDNETLIIKHKDSLESLNFVKEFYSDVNYNDYSFIPIFKEIIFDNFSKTPGFLDIYEAYKEVLDSYLYNVDSFTQFEYYYHIGSKDYYLLSEFYIKNDLTPQIKNDNPVISGVPIPNIKQFRFSKTAFEIYKTCGGNAKMRNCLMQLENHPKVGTDGLIIIHNLLTLITQADIQYFKMYLIDYKNLVKIFNTFDITPKNLMDRAIRALFYYKHTPDVYFRIIVDYIEMCNQVGVPLPKKLPKDVIREHNLLTPKMEYIQNKEKEENFKLWVKENEKLLKFLPVSKNYTIICPETPQDLIYEGMMLNHCVGSYINDFAIGTSKIFFLRQKKDLDTPFVTIELNEHNHVVQSSAKHNRKPSKNALEYINEWQRNIFAGNIIRNNIKDKGRKAS